MLMTLTQLDEALRKKNFELCVQTKALPFSRGSLFRLVERREDNFNASREVRHVEELIRNALTAFLDDAIVHNYPDVGVPKKQWGFEDKTRQ